MTCSEQRQILQKIQLLIAQIQSSLTQAGISKNQIKLYFATKIFKILDKEGLKQRCQISIEKQINLFLERQKNTGKKIREVLISLLTSLEIEKEGIEEFQNYQHQQQPALVLAKRKSSTSSISQTPPLRTQRSSSIWERFTDNEPSYRSPKLSPKFSQLMSFERDLNESLMKTKMLKNIIQQRLRSEVEDTYGNRIRHLHQMLALES